MLNVIIEPEGLPFSIKLREILEDRQANVDFTKNNEKANFEKISTTISDSCFLCSKKYFDSINGPAGLIEMAKSYKAKAIIVISQMDNSFWVKDTKDTKLVLETLLKEWK